jgi:serine protease Do
MNMMAKAEIGAPGNASGFRPVMRMTSLFAGAVMALAIIAAPSVGQAKGAPDSFADLAEKLLPSVVNISTTQAAPAAANRRGGGGGERPQFPPGSPFEDFFKDFFERNQRGGEGGGGGERRAPRRAQSLGSGFIVDSSGIVITNNHVIADADEIKVRLQDDTEYPAKVLGRDPKIDIAVLQIDPQGRKLPAVSFGNSDKLRVGDWVIAIGNPFGLGGTVTAGIVSARGRDINQGPYDDFIQTDASINKGNSGGPLFNLKGEVIGINTAIFSQSGGSVGIGFAVSSRLAKPVIEQLREFGRTRRGWLGVRIQSVSEEIAESLGLSEAAGALVADVTSDGPAEAAGIKAGDVILKFDGKDVESMRRLPRIVAETRIGVEVPVEVWRDGAKVALKATIGELEMAEKNQLLPASQTAGPKAESGRVDELGLNLSGLNNELREKFSLSEEAKGVLITEVDEGSAAAEKGIQPGDMIVEVAQEEVLAPSDVAKALGEAEASGRKSVLLLIERQGEMRFVALRLKKG